MGHNLVSHTNLIFYVSNTQQIQAPRKGALKKERKQEREKGREQRTTERKKKKWKK